MFRRLYIAKIKKGSVERGFSLVELLVSISVLVLVMAVMMAGHRAFNSAVLLRSQAYDIALETRQVQLRAVSVIGGSVASDFRQQHGVFFREASPFFAGRKYQIFRDGLTGTVGVVDFGEEFGRQGIVDSRFYISEIRTKDQSGVEAAIANGVSVMFERPNFDARFYDSNGNLLSDVVAVFIDLRVNGSAGLSGPENVRTIEITRSGQITVLGS